jgi:hypothetical protein
LRSCLLTGAGRVTACPTASAPCALLSCTTGTRSRFRCLGRAVCTCLMTRCSVRTSSGFSLLFPGRRSDICLAAGVRGRASAPPAACWPLFSGRRLNGWRIILRCSHGCFRVRGHNGLGINSCTFLGLRCCNVRTRLHPLPAVLRWLLIFGLEWCFRGRCGFQQRICLRGWGVLIYFPCPLPRRLAWCVPPRLHRWEEHR